MKQLPPNGIEGLSKINQMQTNSSGLKDGAIFSRSEANRIHGYGGPETLTLDEVAIPPYGEAQVLVHVMAAGVNGLDWKIRDGLLQKVRPLDFPATLGFEIAGVVVAAGIHASKFALGDRVVAPLGDMGAYADFVAIDERKLSAIPAGVSDVDAAALPVAALTAWQALEAGGGPRADQKILIHGAAGGVGGFAVQFAKAAGAMVIGTASGADRDYVLGLGADQVIDYKTKRFEDTTSEVNIVLDLVGGDIVDRSWAVLLSNGIIVSTPDPTLSSTGPGGRRAIGVQMHPDPERLETIAVAVAAGTLKSTVAEVTTRSNLPAAVERTKTGHGPGKIVLDLTL